MNRLSVLGQKLDKNVQFEIETIRTVTFIIVRSNIQTFKHDQTFPWNFSAGTFSTYIQWVNGVTK